MTSLANYIILEPLKSLNPKLTVAQLLHFEHCTSISFFFSIFQEMTKWEFHIPTEIPCATASKGAFFGTFFRSAGRKESTKNLCKLTYDFSPAERKYEKINSPTYTVGVDSISTRREA